MSLSAAQIENYTFLRIGEGPRGLILTHEFLPSEASKESHSFGWRGSFDRLAEVLA